MLAAGLLGLLAISSIAGADPSPTTAEPIVAHDQSVIVRHQPRGPNPVHGHRYAPVTIDFFCELQKHYSMRPLYHNLMALAQRHPHRLRIVYHMVDRPARAELSWHALEAFTQGRFHQFIAEFFVPQRRPQPRELEAVAERAGVDYQLMKRAETDGRHQRTHTRNLNYRSRRKGTSRSDPIILFNGTLPQTPSARLSLDELEDEYDTAYARARELLEEGVPLAQLYEHSLRAVDAARPPPPTRTSLVDGLPRDVKPEPIPARLIAGPIAAGGSFDRGADDPAVVVVFLCSLQSWNCAMMYRTIEDLRRAYPEEVRVGFRHLFNDADRNQPGARLAHEAALCADDQGAFWAYYDRMYTHLRRRRSPRHPSPYDMEQVAKAIGIEPASFIACIRAKQHAAAIERELRSVRASGITLTPSVIVGGRLHTGTKSLDEMRSLIEEELRPGLLEQTFPLEVRSAQEL